MTLSTLAMLALLHAILDFGLIAVGIAVKGFVMRLPRAAEVIRGDPRLVEAGAKFAQMTSPKGAVMRAFGIATLWLAISGLAAATGLVVA